MDHCLFRKIFVEFEDIPLYGQSFPSLYIFALIFFNCIRIKLPVYPAVLAEDILGCFFSEDSVSQVLFQAVWQVLKIILHQISIVL